ncbi:hypothetical protein PRIPAC_79424 [Pristionchus pacificus]|uniref:Uncharacterized protein n=1 Tax=Pristionchus pacificus TaxID=54126 RepID=A0A2A6CLU4_PRIPA|nr:hypothetical protein PRIPAC_79424 [Pristionchus pacificus]|eukprot:PDM79047.1 hypothetical protein PRIPAC_31626 [Pristionchus pacificus]
MGDVSKIASDWSALIIQISLIIELFVIIIGLVFSTIAINVFVKSSAVHLNFTRIVIAFASNFYILSVSRLVLMIFEFGFKDVEGNTIALIYIAINFGIMTLISFLMLQSFLYYTNIDDNIASLFFALYNLQHTIAMVVKNAIFVFSLPAWKRDFHQIISRFLPCISPATSLVSVIKQENDVGDQYFNSLAGLWDNRLLVNN